MKQFLLHTKCFKSHATCVTERQFDVGVLDIHYNEKKRLLKRKELRLKAWVYDNYLTLIDSVNIAARYILIEIKVSRLHSISPIT